MLRRYIIAFLLSAICFKLTPLIIQRGAFDHIPLGEAVAWFVNPSAFIYFGVFWIIWLAISLLIGVRQNWILHVSGIIFGVLFSLLVFPVSLVSDWESYGYMVDFAIVYLTSLVFFLVAKGVMSINKYRDIH